MPIVETRALLTAALSGELDGVQYRTDGVFGFEVPVAVPGVVSGLLDPRSTWRDPEEYDRTANELARVRESQHLRVASFVGLGHRASSDADSASRYSVA